MLIHHFLEDSAARLPDKVALIHEDVRATYAQINTKANQLARWLVNQGVTKGDRVVIMLENCLEYVISYYAILKTGAVVVPLYTDIKPDGLSYLFGELEPKVVISTSRCEKLLQATDLTPFKIQELIIRDPKLKWATALPPVFPWEDLIGDEACSNPDILIDESALASIIYTSGSPHKPKGVMLSHRNIVSNTHSILQYLHLTQKDIQMVVLPFFYVMGKSLLNTHFSVGGTVVINNKFAYPASVIEQMVEAHVTGFSGVPSTYAYLLHRSPLANYRDRLSTLRYCTQAGGHMSKNIKEELRQILPAHTKIYIMYGATEASARLTYLEPEHFSEKMGSIGKAIPGVDLQVLDVNGQEVSTGQIGELVASGPNIMQGYWKDSKTTAKFLNQNGYHTGDLGYQDEEGYFYVVGRKDNLIKVNGHRINPQEIEDALMETGLVTEAIVLGVPDDILGYKLIAVGVSKKGDCTINQILRECAQMLPKYKLPQDVKLVQALPKSSSGKIDQIKCLEIAKAD